MLLPEEPRRLSSSCFQLAGREERVGVTGFLELEERGAEEEAGASRQLAEVERAGAAASYEELLLPEEPRRLSSSCFQLAGREERVGVTGFLELEERGAEEAGAGASRQLAELERAGAGAEEAEEDEPLPLRRDSSSWRQLAGRTERVGLTRLAAEEARLQIEENGCEYG